MNDFVPPGATRRPKCFSEPSQTMLPGSAAWMAISVSVERIVAPIWHRQEGCCRVLCWSAKC